MRMPPTSHRFECPVAQGGHFPQAGTKPSTTWSPGARPVTPGPTSSTTPAPSWPPMIGRGTGMSPVSRCSSEWHMPDAASLIRTSPSLGGSSSMGSTLHASRSHRTAASVCTVPSQVCGATTTLMGPITEQQRSGRAPPAREVSVGSRTSRHRSEVRPGWHDPATSSRRAVSSASWPPFWQPSSLRFCGVAFFLATGLLAALLRAGAGWREAFFATVFLGPVAAFFLGAVALFFATVDFLAAVFFTPVALRSSGRRGLLGGLLGPVAFFAVGLLGDSGLLGGGLLCSGGLPLAAAALLAAEALCLVAFLAPIALAWRHQPAS